MNRKGENRLACLLLHGFTGNPDEMENLAIFLRHQGCAVTVPQLPGHATRPEDLCGVSYRAWIEASEQAFHRLQQHHTKIFVIGLSMGGALALHLAAHYQFAGVITLAAALRLPWWLEIASYVLAPFNPMRYKPNGSDVNNAAAKALLQNYPCYPLSAVRELMRMLRQVRAELPKVTMPILGVHSSCDHVVPFDNLALLMRRINSPQRQQLVVENSYHVLTVDYDCQMIFQKIWEFIQQYASPANNLASKNMQQPVRQV